MILGVGTGAVVMVAGAGAVVEEGVAIDIVWGTSR